MKKITLLIFVLLFVAACTDGIVNVKQIRQQLPEVSNQKYVKGTEDLPIYSGFKAKENSGVSYDTTSGRIIDAEFYSNNASVIDVENFYQMTLPQLGWALKESRIYERDGERLQFDIIENDGKTILKFNIIPSD
jgi:hypothetical protein